jgi:hypothetical protein
MDDLASALSGTSTDAIGLLRRIRNLPWGTLQACIVEGSGQRQEGIQRAKLITAMNVEIDNLLVRTAAHGDEFKVLWNLCDRAMKMMQMACPEARGPTPDWNNPITAWVAEAQVILRSTESHVRDASETAQKPNEHKQLRL